MLLDDLEGTIKHFWVSNSVCDLYYLYATSLYNGDESTVYGFIGDISTTSYGGVAPHESSASNFGMPLTSSYDNDSI